MSATTVIIATYNSAEYLPNTIGSALEQTCPAAEVIVVDDGSTDTTESLCKQFGGKIRYIRRSNHGVSSTRNHGATMASTPWLLFLDSDDKLLPEAIEKLEHCGETSKAGVAYGHVLLRGKDSTEDRLHSMPTAAGPPPLPAKSQFFRSVITTPGAAIISRPAFEKTGGFVTGYEPMEDRDMWVKLGLMTSFAHCESVVLDKTWREGSAGQQHAKRIWNGLRAQLALPAWADAHQIDASALAADSKILFNHAVKDALWNQSWEIVPALCSAAKRHGHISFWTIYARMKALFHSAATSPPPAWMQPI